MDFLFSLDLTLLLPAFHQFHEMFLSFTCLSISIGFSWLESCQGSSRLPRHSTPWVSLYRAGRFSVDVENSYDSSFYNQTNSFLSSILLLYQEGIDALEEVIYHIETYDVTTIRASTPMFLMSRKIKSLGVKMVLSGEGSDEIFGGYLYFHKAPNKEEFHQETCRKVKLLASLTEITEKRVLVKLSCTTNIRHITVVWYLLLFWIRSKPFIFMTA